MPSGPPADPTGNSGIQQTEDNEVAKLRAMLETYRCDNGIPLPTFTEYLVAAALEAHLDQTNENERREERR